MSQLILNQSGMSAGTGRVRLAAVAVLGLTLAPTRLLVYWFSFLVTDSFFAELLFQFLAGPFEK